MIIVRLASRQNGAVRADQLRSKGISRASITRRVQAGILDLVPRQATFARVMTSRSARRVTAWVQQPDVRR